MHSSKIVHADPCRACVTHGLGLMSMGVIIRKKMYFLKTAFHALQLTAPR